MALPSSRSFLRKERIKPLHDELGYIGMICLTIFSYLMLALVSLPSNGTIGKISPIQQSVSNNSYLVRLLEIFGLKNATPTQLQIAFYLVCVLILVSYLWAIIIFRHREDKGLFIILSVVFGLSVVLVIIPPLLSKDVFSYIYYGRIGAVYHQNPYIITPQRFPNDPLLAYTSLNWKNTAVVYGPIFTYLSIFINMAAGHGITANIYAFKICMVLFHVINIFLIWYLLGMIAPGRQKFGTMIYAWNPLVLIHAIGGGHNDIIMMTFVLVSLVLFLKNRKYLGFTFLCLSVMVKYITVVLVIAYLIYYLSRLARWRDRFKALAVFGLIFLIIAAACFLPLWEGISIFDSMRNNMQFHTVYTPAGWITQAFSFVVGHLFGLSGTTASSIANFMFTLLFLPLLLLFIWFVSRRGYGIAELPNCFFLTVLGFVLFINNLLPFYLVWLFALLPLRKWDVVSKLSLGIGTALAPIGSVLPF